MTGSDQDRLCARAGRALLKTALVAAVAALAVLALSQVVNDRMLDEIKHNLSMGTIIALIILINAVSGVCFLALFAAWRWIRRDLKAEDRLDP